MDKDKLAIEYSKLLIKEQVEVGKILIKGEPFSKYQKVYFSTNENIRDYLKYCNNSGDVALTVMGSGDHLYNLINVGVKTIDTFDTNALTLYLALGLKYAMIKKYSYQEYLNIYNKLIDKNTSLDELTIILKELLIYMDSKYMNYWNNIIEYNYKLQKNKSNINLIHMLYLGILDLEHITFYNNYLSSEYNYNELKKKIDKVSFSFKNLNATNLDILEKEKYDYILLSNILDYFNRYYRLDNKLLDSSLLKEYVNNLKTLLKYDGLIFLHYIIFYATDNQRCFSLFRYPSIKASELEGEQIHKVKTLKSGIYDGIILSKKY